jgi:DNA mismatch repair ATPase MutS
VTVCRPIVVCILIATLGCAYVEPPRDEYALAKAAIDAARSVQAVRYSPGNWHQAEEFYRQARILFNEREYEQARELFFRARKAAERAENSARLLRQKSGDIL